MNEVAAIFIAIAFLTGISVILGVLIYVISKKFSVKVDPRAEKMLSMMPGANCGACGYPGCSGLVDAVIKGEVSKVKACKVISLVNAQKVTDYLNSTPGEDGKRLHVTVQ